VRRPAECRRAIKARTAGSGVVADVFWVIHGIEKLTATALASIAMLEKRRRKEQARPDQAGLG
jgi:hypothetical protein